MSGATIKVVSEHRFVILQERYDLHPQEQNSTQPHHAANMVRKQPQAYTEGAFNCSAGGIQNGEQVTLFHLDPRNACRRSEQKKIRQTLMEDVALFRKRAPVRGILVGGEAYGDESGHTSEKLYHFLRKTLKKSGVEDVSMIWGRRNEDLCGPTAVMYRADKNRWYVSAMLWEENDKDVLTLKELQRVFSKIRLAEGDTLKIGGRVYTAEDLAPAPARKKFQFWPL